MKKIFGILALSLTTLSLSPSGTLAYDDPAVVVCEQLAKAEYPKDAKYERKSVAVDGTLVTLQYEMTILTTKPKTATKMCHFLLDRRNNTYSLVVLGRSSREAECKKLINKQFSTDERELARHGKLLEECARDAEGRLGYLTKVYKILHSTGLYPIPAADTKLEHR